MLHVVQHRIRTVLGLASVVLLTAAAFVVGAEHHSEATTFPGGRCELLFVESSGSPAEIWSISADGTGAESVVSPTNDSVTPVWSPDGTRFAYVGDDWKVFVAEADGSGATEVFDPSPDQANDIAWSADGTHLAVAVYLVGVTIIEADGTDPVVVTGTDDVVRIGWVPNAGPLAGRLAMGRLAGGWSTVAADGTGNTPMTIPSGTETLSFSPDGTKVATAEYRTGSTDVFVMNIDGTGEVEVSSDHEHYDEFPAWSPDGGVIAFTNDESNLFLVSPDGTGLRAFATGTPRATRAAWRPGCAVPPPVPDPEQDPATPRFTG